jgi:hypothetical protein
MVHQVVSANPATAVLGPKLVTAEGKTPSLPAEEVAVLIESIRTTKLHDRRRQQVTRGQVERIRHERKLRRRRGERKVRLG